MPPGGQPPTVAFTVLAQLCGSKANETEMNAGLFTKGREGRTLTLTFAHLMDLGTSYDSLANEITA